MDYLRDNAHLRARTDAVTAMLRVRDQTLQTLHGYLKVCSHIQLADNNVADNLKEPRFLLYAHSDSDF